MVKIKPKVTISEGSALDVRASHQELSNTGNNYTVQNAWIHIVVEILFNVDIGIFN